MIECYTLYCTEFFTYHYLITLIKSFSIQNICLTSNSVPKLEFLWLTA
jgi:hypothetical protein